MSAGRVAATSLITDAAAGRVDGFISAINVGEIYYITARKKGDVKAEATLHALQHFPPEIVEPDYNFCIAAAKIKAAHKMPYADAFAAAHKRIERTPRYRRF